MGLENTQKIQNTFQVVSGTESKTIAKVSHLETSLNIQAQKAHEKGVLKSAWSLRKAEDGHMMFSAADNAANDQEYLGRTGLGEEHYVQSSQLENQSHHAFGQEEEASAKAAQAKQRSEVELAVLKEIQTDMISMLEEDNTTEDSSSHYDMSAPIPTPFGMKVA